MSLLKDNIRLIIIKCSIQSFEKISSSIKYLVNIFKKKENAILLLLSIISVFFIYKSFLFVLAMDINNESDGWGFFWFTNLLYYYNTLYIPHNIPPFFSSLYSPLYYVFNVLIIKLLEIDLNSFDGVMNALFLGRTISFLSLLASMYLFYKILNINNISRKYAILGALVFLLFQSYISVIYRPDSLRMLFFMFYFYFYIKYIIRSKALFLYLSSAFLLIACLVKQDAVVFFIPSILFLLISKNKKHLIIYLSIIVIYIVGGLIILKKLPAIIDSFIYLSRIEGFSIKYYIYFKLPYLIMISPMLVFSIYILLKRSIIFQKLHLFLCLNFFISFFLILIMSARPGGALHYFVMFEAVMLLISLFYIFKKDFVHKSNRKLFIICLIYMVSLIFLKNNTVPVSMSVLTKVPKNNKESLIKAYKTSDFIINELKMEGKHYFITYDHNMIVFSRNNLVIDYYLLIKYHDQKRFALALNKSKDHWEHSREYLVNYIKNGNIPYIVFNSSPKNDKFVKQEYPQYYLFCQYQGHDVFKNKQNLMP